jgi:hypothetical protein
MQVLRHAHRQLLQTANTTLATSDCSVNWGMAQYNPTGRGIVSPVKYQVISQLPGVVQHTHINIIVNPHMPRCNKGATVMR